MPGSALVHEALVYDTDEEFLAAVTPFLTEALDLGEAAVAAVPARTIGLLRQSLGTDARQVTFIDRDAWYQRPAATIAGWTGLLADAAARGHQAIRIVGEVAYGSGERYDTWTRYESAINDVFGDSPAWIICPYDTRHLPESVLTGARRTHPVVSAGSRRPSDLYQRPDRLLPALPEPLPPVSGAATATVALAAWSDVSRARQVVESAVRDGDWETTRVKEILLVITEIAGNSLRHGRGDRRLNIWAGRPALTCEVLDNGDGFRDPLAGYRPANRPGGAGHGLWLAGQLSDWLAIEHRDGTTRVRFRFTR
jgi:anti-sigma regulatory factor (Ser/Thr protein kinase)